MRDFNTVIEAVSKVTAFAEDPKATENTDFALAVENLSSVLEEHRVKDGFVVRSMPQQVLFMAAVVFDLKWNAETGVTAALADLKDEFESFVTEAAYSVLRAPAATTSALVAEGYQPSSRAMSAVVREAEAALRLSLADFDGASLKLALMDLEAVTTKPTAGEDSVVIACHEFLRAVRFHKSFGDSMEAATDSLSSALKALTAPPRMDPYADIPYLYVLMRNDLASMNAGKAVAQGSHAANQMVFRALLGDEYVPLSEDASPQERRTHLVDALLTALTKVRKSSADGCLTQKVLLDWMLSANGFGTCIVKSVNEREMRETIEAAKAAGVHSALTHDPTYPLKDGATLHLIPLDTCAFVFGKKKDAQPFVAKFPLMP